MNKEEKKYIAPNEASLGRWIATLAVAAVIGILFFGAIAVLLMRKPGTLMGIPSSQVLLNLGFAIYFWAFVIALKLVGKTSLKDFVLGVGGKINKKECLIVLGLYLAGCVLSYLPSIGNIRPRGVNPGEFAFLIVFMLLFVWMQSTLEELVFRGLLVRWACKNNIGFTKKAIIVSFITSLAFALAHASNPEVTSESGIRVVMAIASYGISGFLFFFITMYFGSLMPAIVVHWVNNFMLSTIISSETSALSAPTLLIDGTPHTADLMLISNFLPWLPLLVYILIDAMKKKKAASMD